MQPGKRSGEIRSRPSGYGTANTMGSPKDGEHKGDQQTLLAKLNETLLEVVSSLPSSNEPTSATPDERTRQIANAAAVKSAMVSGGLALPPGPLGMLTIIPDLLVIWRIQSQMVADIAATLGKTAFLTREQMIYCLFRHAASQVVRDLVVRVGERVLVRRVSLRVIQNILKRIGVVISQRLAGRGISRWLPIIGAVGVGAYAYYDTARVAKTAIEFFRSKLELEPSDETKES